LHWAASSDDVSLIDALLDAGADIERSGSSINGGSPLSCAVGYGQWVAARRLVDRGAKTVLWHEAALGLLERIAQRFEAGPHPGPDLVRAITAGNRAAVVPRRYSGLADRKRGGAARSRPGHAR
jgi:hypothetical protein